MSVIALTVALSRSAVAFGQLALTAIEDLLIDVESRLEDRP